MAERGTLWEVNEGDNIWNIGMQYLDPETATLEDYAQAMSRIIQENLDQLNGNPDLIYPGQVLVIPDDVRLLNPATVAADEAAKKQADKPRNKPGKPEYSESGNRPDKEGTGPGSSKSSKSGKSKYSESGNRPDKEGIGPGISKPGKPGKEGTGPSNYNYGPDMPGYSESGNRSDTGRQEVTDMPRYTTSSTRPSGNYNYGPDMPGYSESGNRRVPPIVPSEAVRNRPVMGGTGPSSGRQEVTDMPRYTTSSTRPSGNYNYGPDMPGYSESGNRRVPPNVPSEAVRNRPGMGGGGYDGPPTRATRWPEGEGVAPGPSSTRRNIPTSSKIKSRGDSGGSVRDMVENGTYRPGARQVLEENQYGGVVEGALKRRRFPGRPRR